MRRISPGVWGWIGCAVSFAAADGYAKTKQWQGHRAEDYPTMSDEFSFHPGWGLFFLAGTAAHLVTHRRINGAR